MFEIHDVAIIPLILALVQFFKKVGLPEKYSPIIAVFFGLFAGIFYLDAPIKEGIIVGLMLGLSATGLYSGTKNLVKSDGK
ncbi:hypothetical protein FOA22_12435 [Heyndrickxia oleronia]|uniref:hypothetical protein n=1 Tax=Heyndrickxia oleronia TaxID=38875 RepID=UPI00333C04A5